jgi:hypothetical protein
MQGGRSLEMVAQRVERASALDRLAAGAQGLGRKAVPEGPVKDVLQGTPLGGCTSERTYRWTCSAAQHSASPLPAPSG